MAIETLAYKLVMDHKQFVSGSVASRKELNLAKKVMFETKTPAEKLETSLKSLGALYKKGAIDVHTYRRAHQQLSGQMKTTKTTAASLGAELGKFGSAIVGGALVSRVGGAALRATRDFESAMARSTAIIADMNGQIRHEMTRTAKEVAKDTPFSTKDAAEAYFFLGSAGMNATQQIAALPKVAKFAQAGNFDLALATDLLTDAQSALGLTSKDTAENMRNMTRVADVLVKANTIANASVQQFSESLTNKAGAALRQTNKSIEEGVAVLAAFADQGVKGADGGTALAIVLRELTTKALRNERAFKSAGIAVFDANGKMHAMSDIVADLESKLGPLSVAQRKATLMALGFTDKSVGYIAALVGMSKAIKDYRGDLNTATGTMEDIADKTVPEFEKSMNRLSASFQSVSHKGLGPFLKLLSKGLDKLDEATDNPMFKLFGPGQAFLNAPPADAVDRAAQPDRSVRRFPFAFNPAQAFANASRRGPNFHAKELAQRFPFGNPNVVRAEVKEFRAGIAARNARIAEELAGPAPFNLDQRTVDKAKANVAKAAKKTLQVLERIEQNTRDALKIEEVNF